MKRGRPAEVPRSFGSFKVGRYPRWAARNSHLAAERGLTVGGAARQQRRRRKGRRR